MRMGGSLSSFYIANGFRGRIAGAEALTHFIHGRWRYGRRPGHQAHAKFAEIFFEDHLENPNSHRHGQRYTHRQAQILSSFLRNTVQYAAEIYHQAAEKPGGPA